MSADSPLRLDQALVNHGLVTSRSLARRLVLAGHVRVNGRSVHKPGTPIKPGAELEVAERPRYASRGGDKLAPVLAASGIDVGSAVCLDLGASTGGFTDCLLQNGARTVVAVDVGYGQLAWKLRQDPRVHVLERCNARHLTGESLPPGLSGAITVMTIDVSFIGVLKLLPAATRLCDPRCEALVLVKPQFEAGPKEVERGGVVRAAHTRRRTVEQVGNGARDLCWQVRHAYPSPLRGPRGNWECFLHLRRHAGASAPVDNDWLDDLEVPDD